jgi:hypothetical protein
MSGKPERFFIDGTSGAQECALELPDADAFPAPRGLVLIAHPHPLFGGTMENKVVTTFARTFLGLGYIAARMNFRGVGQSAGTHDEGRGETDDMALLFNHLHERYPDLPVVLAGFSFGTYVQAQLQQRLTAQGTPAKRLVFAGTAAGKWPMPEVPAGTILIHGEQDDTIPLQNVFDWARPQDLPVIVIPGCDHFFNRKLQHIKNLVVELWRD